MKLGVIARGEDRGLGNQTWEACKHLEPERVLLIDPGPDRRFTQHPERYEPWDTTTVRWTAGRLDETTTVPWTAGLDVIYTAETPYDERLPGWAHKVRCGVVVHANPEFLTAGDARAAVTWWAATPWRLDKLPARTRIVPMPAPQSPVHNEPAGRVRFLHVAGWPTVADRNGTDLVVAAASKMTAEADLVLRGQHDSINWHRINHRSPVRLRVEHGNVADYWDLYRDADVLVMPRRFGGLCLPALEAMASGLPVVMPDCPPNEVWPGPRVPSRPGQMVGTRAGPIELQETDIVALARTMDELATDRELLTKLADEAHDWAQANSWPALRNLWWDELARAC